MQNGKKRWSSPSAFVTILMPLVILLPLASGDYPTWSIVSNETFNHMTIHPSTGHVFIGAINHIYQLSSELAIEETAIMGPQPDSPRCPATKLCPRESKTSTDYYNKALLIAPSGRKLIACGSLFQGVCTEHEVDDVTDFRTLATQAVVANSRPASTVAFIAPGTQKLNGADVLYVAVTYTGNGPYSEDVPSVSSRSLEHGNMLKISPPEARIFVNSMNRDVYPITFVSGFSSEGFSYFLTVQKKYVDASSSAPFFSKLVRVCQNDDHYYSYTEIPIICRAEDGTDYNLIRAAHVGLPGSELAESLGISKQDSVLFAVFAKSKDRPERYNEPIQNSALCVYSLPAIRRKFTQNIQHCFNGNGDTGLDFINPSRPCYKTLLQISDTFCGMDVNFLLEGNMPVEAAPLFRLPGILLTAVTATTTYDYTVAFLGTATGHLKKVVLETAASASEYSDTVIDEDSPVNADMLFDKEKNYLYVMTERKVTKVKVQGCDAFGTCVDCLAARDPYCGWCFSTNKCLPRQACSETADGSLNWLSYKSTRCHAVTSSETAEGSMERSGLRGKEGEGQKIQTLRDIAQSLRNMDNSLKELVELQRKG